MTTAVRRPRQRRPRVLPEVLSDGEVRALLVACGDRLRSCAREQRPAPARPATHETLP